MLVETGASYPFSLGIELVVLGGGITERKWAQWLGERAFVAFVDVPLGLHLKQSAD